MARYAVRSRATTRTTSGLTVIPRSDCRRRCHLKDRGKGGEVGPDESRGAGSMMNERVCEMVSLIARGRQQWCDCLRRYSISTREPAPFRLSAPSSPFYRPRCNPLQLRVLFPRFLTACSSPVRCVRSRVRIGAIIVASV